ncbi:hypothetical protein Tsubulata_001314 [Turnera subulata]|uniref:Uncharacterized protein n=1 Tax=Turnera subulata TaxID=218843 RepID=A0A9Q0FEP8_9ROSI|nr:hypothetical protein Tsubulata_001314 [Turnera subulata]
MDPTTSSYRFLGFPSTTTATSSPSPDATLNGNDELTEDDILWTNDFPEQQPSPPPPDSQRHPPQSYNHRNNGSHHPHPDDVNNHIRPNGRGTSSFPKNAGILAALPESNHHTVLCRKPSLPSSLSSSSSSSSAKSIPLIPRPPQQGVGGGEYGGGVAQSAPLGRKMNQSMPMDVPLLSIAMAKQRNMKFVGEEDGGDEGEEMLPPHEIVARGSHREPKTTFSVLEGVGRTLKGRDLRQGYPNHLHLFAAVIPKSTRIQHLFSSRPQIWSWHQPSPPNPPVYNTYSLPDPRYGVGITEGVSPGPQFLFRFHMLQEYPAQGSNWRNGERYKEFMAVKLTLSPKIRENLSSQADSSTFSKSDAASTAVDRRFLGSLQYRCFPETQCRELTMAGKAKFVIDLSNEADDCKPSDEASLGSLVAHTDMGSWRELGTRTMDWNIASIAPNNLVSLGNFDDVSVSAVNSEANRAADLLAKNARTHWGTGLGICQMPNLDLQ